MGNVTRLRKLRRLEGRVEDVRGRVARLEEHGRERVLMAAVAHLSDEDLRALLALCDAAELRLGAADPGAPAELAPETLWELAGELPDGRAALERFQAILA